VEPLVIDQLQFTQLGSNFHPANSFIFLMARISAVRWDLLRLP